VPRVCRVRRGENMGHFSMEKSPPAGSDLNGNQQQTLLSRLNDKAAGRVVIIQQRIHEDDLPGYLIEGGQFVHLNLPAIAVSQEKVPLGLAIAAPVPVIPISPMP
ncbi:MAG: phage uncharacterized protein, partial [Microvirga sp.]|nr:phage uncharacterized protein [Microvirga sp.]